MNIKLSNDKNCILSTTLDDRLRLFDRATGELLAEYSGHSNSEYRVQACFSYTDATVFCGSEDGTVHAWDLVSQDSQMVLRAHNDAVTCISYHPTEHRFATGSLDGTVKIWK